MSSEQASARTVMGTVVSNKMDKTIVVLVERRVKHPKYGKIVKKSSKMHAHVDSDMPNIGSKVMIKESKPYSKTKTWQLVEVVS
jgi:small subunit ribosomal protein S17